MRQKIKILPQSIKKKGGKRNKIKISQIEKVKKK
jgi:hypothetical protein